MPIKSTFAMKHHPIFILGILQRSGTNFLNNLLLLHPDVKSPGLVWEDFFLAHGDLLSEYVDKTQRRWAPQWAEAIRAEFGQQALLESLGNSLIGLMEAQYCSHAISADGHSQSETTPVRLVTATPSVSNLHMFFDLFPNAAPIIIVRDGRALVESGVRSFGWDYEEAMRMWANGARTISDFCSSPANKNRFLLVRYEDLFARTNEEMKKVLEFLGLDRDKFNFQAAANLGVMGSSEIMQAEGALHWKSIDKSAEFNPLARASEWGPKLRSRFKWVAGDEMGALGYKVYDASRHSIWNTVIDRVYGLEIKLKKYSPSIGPILKSWRYRLMHVPKKRKAIK